MRFRAPFFTSRSGFFRRLVRDNFLFFEAHFFHFSEQESCGYLNKSTPFPVDNFQLL